MRGIPTLFLLSFFLSAGFFLGQPRVLANDAGHVLPDKEKWIEPIFGPEFTFQDPSAPDTSTVYSRVYNRVREHLVLGQPMAEKFTMGSMGYFNSPEGWDFELTTDIGVVEVKMSPMTVADYQKFATNIQDAIFVSAANVNAFPALFAGGGHINIGITELEHDPLLIRNFVVDFINHAELAMGILNYDTNNALPFQLGLPLQWEGLKSALATFDAVPVPTMFDLHVLLYEIRSLYSGARFVDNDPFVSKWGLVGRGKYMALSFFRVDDRGGSHSRLEVRSVRAQTDIYTFINQISLLRGRLQYLKRLNFAVPLKTEITLDSKIDPNGKHLLTPPVDPQEALRAFYRYVTESGEDWQNHRNYIWPQWITSGELEKFESSGWFRQRQIHCRQLLSRN